VRRGIGDKNSNLACVGIGGGRGGGGEGGRGTPFEVEEVVQSVRHGFGTVAPTFGCHAVDVVGDGGQVGCEGEDPRHVGRILEMEEGKDGRGGLGEVNRTARSDQDCDKQDYVRRYSRAEEKGEEE